MDTRLLILTFGAIAVSTTLAGAQPVRPDPAIADHAQALLHAPGTQALGNLNGDVTLVEYFDYACPYCRAAEPRIEALLKSDKGVRLVVKEFPVLSPQSVVASRAALAAARQGKYAAFHQQLLLYRGALDEAVIFGVAQDVGCDIARLKRDMADPAIAREIDANLALAKAIGVHGTPTFILDDRIVDQPSASIDFPALAAASRHARG